MQSVGYWGFAVVFGSLAFIGFLTVLQLARLRSAWRSSAQAMIQIEDYYREHCPDADLEKAFAWTSETLPSGAKRNSVAFLLTLSVILIDAGAAVAGAAFMGVAMNWTLAQMWPLLVLAGVVFSGIQFRLYFDWAGR